MIIFRCKLDVAVFNSEHLYQRRLNRPETAYTRSKRSL
jgi:hypothetical protein